MSRRYDYRDPLAKAASSVSSARFGVAEILVGLLVGIVVVAVVSVPLVIMYYWDWSDLPDLSGAAENKVIPSKHIPSESIHSQYIPSETNDEVVVEPPVVEPSPLRLTNVIPPSHLSAFVGEVGAVAFRPGTNLIGMAEDEGLVWLYDGTSGSPLRPFGTRNRDYFRIAFSPDGSLLAAASRGGVYCWETDTGELVFSTTGVQSMKRGRRIQTMLNVTGDIAFSGDGRYLAVCDDDQVAILNTADGKTVQLLRGDTRSNRSGGYQLFRCLCFATGTNDLYMGSWHSEDRYYSIESWQPGMDRIRAVSYVSSPAAMLVSSRDGKSIAMQTDSGEIKVMWIVSAGPPGTGRDARLEVVSDPAQSLAFWGDNRFLVGGGSGNSIRFWKPDSTEEPMRFTCFGNQIGASDKAPGPSVRCVSANDDGTLVAVGCSDRRMRILQLDPL